MNPLDFIYLKGKETPDFTREKGRNLGAKREKGSGMIFEINSDLTYSCARTHERNETISRLVSAPQAPIYIYGICNIISHLANIDFLTFNIYFFFFDNPLNLGCYL